MSTYKWLLDAGHGGVTPDGKYTSAATTMHTFNDGLTVYEGAINRAIVDLLIQDLEYGGVDYEMIHDEFMDTPLEERVAIANKYYAENNRCVYLSVHSDKMPPGMNRNGSGFGFYTWKGKQWSGIDDFRSEQLSVGFKIAYKHFSKELSFKIRKDLVGDREDFYVLRETNCPAVLIQNMFYDNRRDAEFLLSEDGQLKIATALLYGIAMTEEAKPF